MASLLNVVKSEDYAPASVCQSSVGGRESALRGLWMWIWEMETKTVSQEKPAIFLKALKFNKNLWDKSKVEMKFTER